jgi:hypothetical protein
MAVSAINHEQHRLSELKHRIEFFRDSMDHDLLIGSIERELQTFCEFQYEYSKDVFDIASKPLHSFGIRVLGMPQQRRTATRPRETKLEALWNESHNLIKD